MNRPHYDVIIIGAGLSGIGTACRLAEQCPDMNIAILERRERIGGTWDLFRYPGIRSDSDILSFGYSFKPWNGSTTLADGGAIRDYIQQTAHEYGIKDKVHYGLKITNANWSSESRCWYITALKEGTNETVTYSCDFFVGCTGYYNYDEGFRPTFPGENDFKGTIVHPQHWPENLDYAGKKVVVIGSGATSVTLVPSMAKTAKHVTMLQRSPSYIYSIPAKDPITIALQRLLPSQWAFKVARQRNILTQRLVYLACRKWPNLMRRYLLSHVRNRVGPNIDMAHFTPKYMPWDERVCAVPDADLFKALRTGTASIETDHIERFTANGILLKSGKTLDADIIVTATGLNMQILGGMELAIDGKAQTLGDKMAYKGLLIENIPNMAWIFGYVNASWTLKVNITGNYLARLFKYMKERNLDVVVPRDNGQNKLKEGILDTMSSGYVQRSKESLPRQGKAYPWRTLMSFGRDKKVLTEYPIEDQYLTFPADNCKKSMYTKSKSKAA